MASVLVVTFAFLTESAPHAAAGAMALENMLRNSAAAVVAVITPPLVAKMGHGWFFTGLALLDLVSVGVGGYRKCRSSLPLSLLCTCSDGCHSD